MGSIYKRKDRSGNYYASYNDHEGRRVRVNTGTRDKVAAKQILGKLETDAARRKAGIIDARAERIAKKSSQSLESHLSDYMDSFRSKGNTDLHIHQTRTRIKAIADSAGITTLAEITPESVEQHTASLRSLGRSLRTIESYIQSIKGLTRWAMETGRIASDPLVSVKKPNPDADRRVERRALSVEEWRLLTTATLAGDVSYGVESQERALLYETALQTGLRSNELRSLRRGRLHLHSSPPFVLVQSRSTKNHKPARQYVTDDLAKRLANHVKKTKSATVFKLPYPTNMARMLRADLKAARSSWLDECKTKQARRKREATDFLADKNHDELVIDFHALRHTCGAWLAMAGVHPKAIQTIMRHSDIRLTLDTYGHLFPAMEAQAISKLGLMVNGVEPHSLITKQQKPGDK